jgi:hypothetical protein
MYSSKSGSLPPDRIQPTVPRETFGVQEKSNQPLCFVNLIVDTVPSRDDW